MPRHTHPTPVGKHPRSHTRAYQHLTVREPWRYCRGCMACKPYRHHPGYRGQVKNRLREEIEAGLLDHVDHEPVFGRLVSSGRPFLGNQGWC